MKQKRIFSLTITAVLFLVLTLSLSSATSEKKPMTFVDTINIKRVSAPKLSPDGKQFLFSISKADWEKNKRFTHIWRINIDGTGLVQLTNGKESEAAGAWSPNSKFISFIAKRNKKRQIYLLNNKGGEALELTNHKTDIETYKWSPCSKKIFFIAKDALSDEEEKKKKEKDDAFIFENNFKHSHLWVMEMESKEEKCLTKGDFTVNDFSISAGGSKIVYTAAPSPLYDDSLKSEIYTMELTDGTARRITNNGVEESNCRFSPGNRRILFISETNEAFTHYYYQATLFVVPAEGGNPQIVLPGFKYEVRRAVWSSTGKTIYFTANMGVHTEIFSLSLKDLKVKQLTNDKHAIYRPDYIPKIDKMLYLSNSPQNPGTFWLANMKRFSTKMIYDPYPELNRFKLANYEVVQWKSTDGKTVEGILIYPVDYEKGKRYPLLAHTHGGPMGSDKLTFDGYAHARAGKGYAVFKPNYRGSTGYGNDVLRDMVGHYFLHADDDVLTGVDYLVERGIADPGQLGTLGWSAGGHMTNWLITQTDRFKAASSGAGASNWISMYSPE
jgi:dipeptidyl aminopeptidase/acylaminoacyl peptidase